MKEKILITGAAGFIGYHLSRKLLENEYIVIGIDNLNDYYDPSLKKQRLDILNQFTQFKFKKANISDKETLFHIFEKEKPDIVINLAAQAGVRYSILNPDAYMESNIIGFYQILEACRNYPVKHLIFASSSSVYGNQDNVPFRTDDKVDYPISLYAASKKSNELMAYTYSHLYDIKITGLRFFTVYGPFGRPDMAYFSFADKICKGETINIYNNGNMYRDFTYIDDVVACLEKMILSPPIKNERGDCYKIYNIGNNHPEKLMDFVNILEKELDKTAKKEFLPMQPGDVYKTYADVSELERDFNFKPATTLEEGLKRFIVWFKQYKQ